eukprot:12939242-Prorocentrum_lima.AAC.1
MHTLIADGVGAAFGSVVQAGGSRQALAAMMAALVRSLVDQTHAVPVPAPSMAQGDQQSAADDDVDQRIQAVLHGLHQQMADATVLGIPDGGRLPGIRQGAARKARNSALHVAGKVWKTGSAGKLDVAAGPQPL